MKIITFLRGKGAAAPYQDWLVRQAEGLANTMPDGLVLNLIDPTPEDIPYRPANDVNLREARPRYDAALEAWGDSEALAARVREAVTGETALCHIYEVEETVILDRAPAAGRPSAGLKLMGQLMFHADMPDSAVRRSWALHAPLAVRVHIGAGRYVQNFVTRSFDADAPTTRGIPQMHFPTRADLIERFVDSPRGMQEILQDTAHFVAGGPRFYTREMVLRPPRRHSSQAAITPP